MNTETMKKVQEIFNERVPAVGWKAKIGLLVPDSNCNIEPHFYSMVPEGVSVHSARMALGQVCTPDTLKAMAADIERASRLLASIPVDILVLGCTSGSFIGGSEYDQKEIEMMEKASNGIRATTTSTSAKEALRTMNLKNICVCTPYIKETNQVLKEFFEAEGFNIAEVRGLELLTNNEYSSQSPSTIFNLAWTTYRDHPDVDGIFISCTSLRSPEIIEALENNINKPVVTATQASCWNALRRIGINEPVKGFGRLLREH